MQGYRLFMQNETTPQSTSAVIDMTAGFDLAQVEHPYAAAESVLAAA